MIYFVKCCCPIGYIQIGYTRDVATRLDGLQTANPYTLEIVLTIEGKRSAEGELHRRFAHLKENGEWFRPDPEILDYIESRRAEDLGPQAHNPPPIEAYERRMAKNIAKRHAARPAFPSPSP
jgi:hypothetical protein